ncbi:uncharacterized protein LOC125178600 [Hyalella azteca]|uniref:Uncharacterized protein LOC125178600 n=1 Tax=Hyalella azteca TaxID=294128 RepID=A0A979FQL8_HYAAZ|nr:uncharacterized protein LOC125178600 [Hyalella azteca]
MAPVMEVASLKEIIVFYCADWLLACIKRHPSFLVRHIQREYIRRRLSPFSRQELLSYVLSLPMESVLPKDRIKIIEMLGGEKITSFDATPLGRQNAVDVKYLYRALAAFPSLNVTRLGIICQQIILLYNCYTEFNVNTDFYPTLRKMSHLTCVTLIALGDEKVLSILGSNCENLQYLDISFSEKVNDASLACLYLSHPRRLPELWDGQRSYIVTRFSKCCKKIKFLNLVGTSVTAQTINLLTQLMPNLESFGGYLRMSELFTALAMPYVGYPLVRRDGNPEFCLLLEVYDLQRGGWHKLSVKNQKIIASERLRKVASAGRNKEPSGIFVPPSLPLKLAELTNFSREVDPKVISVLHDLCPHVYELHILSSSLPNLAQFHDVKVLEVRCQFVQGWNVNLINYLMQRGSSLKTLVTSQTTEEFIPLSRLRSACPNLVDLNLPIDTEDDIRCTLPQLKCAKIAVRSWSVFKYFCRDHTQLKELNAMLRYGGESDIPGQTTMTDSFFRSIFLSYSFVYLEKLIIFGCDLGASTLELCLGPCFPRLRVLGYVDRWKNLTESQLAHYRREIRVRNLNLKLINFKYDNVMNGSIAEDLKLQLW